MERIGIDGIIRLYKIPDEWTDADYTYWWMPREMDEHHHVLVPARISDETKRDWLVMEQHNLVTTVGLTLLLNNMSVANQSQQFPFTQIMSVGNGTVSGITRADTSVPGDGFGTNARRAPNNYAVTGYTTIISTNYASGDAVGQWTSAGFYGYKVASSQNATTTTGTGALMTHCLFNFTKGSVAYGVDYAFSLVN